MAYSEVGLLGTPGITPKHSSCAGGGDIHRKRHTITPLGSPRGAAENTTATAPAEEKPAEEKPAEENERPRKHSRELAVGGPVTFGPAQGLYG